MKLPTLPQKLIILGLTLLAFLLRAYRLDVQSYWLDEAWTLYFINLPFDRLWHLLQTEEPKPPFYYLTTFQWIRLVGRGEFSLRFFSVIFGTLAIPLTYRLGKALGDSRLGLITALLMAVAPYQIWHSQDARMYSIFTAASIMSMWGFVNLWKRGGWRWWLIYVIGTEWAIMTHYHALIIIGIQGLFLLLTWRRHWRGYLAWGGTLLLIFLLYAPWLLFGGGLLQSFLHWIKQPDTLWETYRRGAIAYAVGELVPPAQAIPLTLVFVGFYGLGLIYAARRSWDSWRGWEMLAFLLAYTLAPNVAAWLYGELRTPVYLERYLIPVQVGYLLTVAMGLLAIVDWLPTVVTRIVGKQTPRLKWGAYLVAALALLTLIIISSWVLRHYYFDPAYARPDWRAVAQKVQNFSQPGDAIIITGDDGDKAFNLYYQGILPIYLDFNTPVPTQSQARQEIADIAATHRRIWYTPYGVDIDATLETWLAQNTYPAWHSWLGRKRLALYESNAATDRLESLNYTFADDQGHGPTLVSVALPNGSTAAGDLLPLTLTWQTDTPLDRDYQLSLRLSNNFGDIFAQSDWPPLAAVGSTSTWSANQPIIDRRSFWLPADLPPGQYALQFVLYDPSTGQALGQPVTLNNISVNAAEIVVAPEALSIPNPLPNPKSQNSNPKLIGYAQPDTIQPGQEMWLWLYWQAAGPIDDGAVRVSLASQDETISTDFPLPESLGPLDSWQPGQIRRTVYHLPTSPRLTGETAELKVAVISKTGQVEGEIPVAQVVLETRPRQFEPPQITQPTDIAFGQPTLLNLIGYDLPQTKPSHGGETLPITLYWQAEAEMEVNYTVFVQLLNSNGQVLAQVDLQPLGGAAPTTTWLPGEILTDPYTLTPPPDLPPGNYSLITGLYNAATGKRLPAASGSDFVELTEVTVE
jgi:hypothetical protein